MDYIYCFEILTKLNYIGAAIYIIYSFYSYNNVRILKSYIYKRKIN